MTPRWKRRKRHAASRARKLAAVLSVCAFVTIGQAINLAAPGVSTAHNGALVQSAGSPLAPFCIEAVGDRLGGASHDQGGDQHPCGLTCASAGWGPTSI